MRDSIGNQPNPTISIDFVRLSRPHLEESKWPIFLSALRSEIFEGSGAPKTPTLEFNECLTLPSENEPVLGLGETLNAYIRVTNTLSHTILNLSCHVNIEKKGENVKVYDNSSAPLRQLIPASAHSMLISYQLQTLGSVQVNCSISYQLTALSDVKVLKRCFPIQTSQLFDTNHKLEIVGDSAFLEIQVHSKLTSCFVSNVRSVPSPGVQWSLIEHPVSSPLMALAQPNKYLQIGDKISFLYKISPATETSRALKDVSRFGFLEMSWVSIGGSTGSTVVCKAENPDFISKKAESIEFLKVVMPSSVTVMEPFECTVQFINHTKFPLTHLIVNLDTEFVFTQESPSYVCLDRTPIYIPRVDPASKTTFKLTLACPAPGFHLLDGFYIYDTTTAQKWCLPKELLPCCAVVKQNNMGTH